MGSVLGSGRPHSAQYTSVVTAKVIQFPLERRLEAIAAERQKQWADLAEHADVTVTASPGVEVTITSDWFGVRLRPDNAFVPDDDAAPS